MDQFEFTARSIGIIHSPFQNLEGMPIQPRASDGAPGKVVLREEFVPGLKDLEGFSHLILVYYFHSHSGYQLLVKPFLDDMQRGVFATRAPRRPNPIGISVVRLRSITGNVIKVDHLDILDGTPLLDIKPHVPDFDPPGEVQIGWLEKQRHKIGGQLSDDRFS